MATTLQGKYAEHLEIENKQLRKALKEERERNKKAIEYIKNDIEDEFCKITYFRPNIGTSNYKEFWLKNLLEILGEKK